MSYRARVTAVSEDLDQAFWIKVGWPQIGGEHPDFVRPMPAPMLVMPQVGQFVEVERIPGRPDDWWWFGPAWRREDLPDDLADLYPNVAGIMVAEGASVVLARDGRVFVRGSGTIVVDGGTIELGEGATESVVLGDTFKAYSDGHVHLYTQPLHPGVPGPTGAPTVAMPANALSGTVKAT